MTPEERLVRMRRAVAAAYANQEAAAEAVIRAGGALAATDAQFERWSEAEQQYFACIRDARAALAAVLGESEADA